MGFIHKNYINDEIVLKQFLSKNFHNRGFQLPVMFKDQALLVGQVIRQIDLVWRPAGIVPSQHVVVHVDGPAVPDGVEETLLHHLPRAVGWQP